MMLIGLSGKKRSGKNTVANLIEGIAKEKGMRVRQIAFADALKKELAECLGVSVQHIDEHKPAFRLGLQWYGTEYRRGLSGDNYWVNKVKAVIDNDPCKFTTLWIITDCRFPNEGELVRQLGGINVRVNRPGPWWKRWIKKRDMHDSEIAMDDYVFDSWIDNTWNLDGLKWRVQEFWIECVEKMWHFSPPHAPIKPKKVY